MTFPIIQKYLTAGMLLNQRITFTSLVNTMGSYISGIGNHLISQGYTCSGSSNGTTGAMDGVNRCTSAAGYAVRGANTTTAQSWLCVRAANGVQTLFCYQGGSDHLGKVSMSPGGLFVAAGTPTFQPTATDELIIIANTADIINSVASGDRIYNVWVDPASNGWRSCMFRANVVVGVSMGVELYDPSFLVSPVTVPVPAWGFAYNPANMSAIHNSGSGQGAGSGYGASQTGGLCRLMLSGSPINASLGATWKSFGALTGIELDGISLVGNGSLTAIRTFGLFTLTSNIGDVGNRFDWHFCHDRQACGNLDASGTWIMLNQAIASGTTGGVIWPWNPALAWVGS